MTKGYGRGGPGIHVPGFQLYTTLTSTQTINMSTNVDTPFTFDNAIGPMPTVNATPSGLIYHKGAGVIRLDGTGPFFIKTRARVARSSNPGTTDFFMVLEAGNELAPGFWQKVGQSTDYKLSDSDSLDVFFDSTPIEFTKNTLLRIVGRLSTAGSNDGYITPGVPDAGMITDGWTSAPSYQVSVYTSQEFDYDQD